MDSATESATVKVARTYTAGELLAEVIANNSIIIEGHSAQRIREFLSWSDVKLDVQDLGAGMVRVAVL